MSIFDKWNADMNVSALAQDVKEVSKSNDNSNEYKEVPVGKYYVTIDKMEIKESRKGNPMVFVQFRIVDGEFKNSCLFMNQVITQGFQIAQANEFLRSLEAVPTVEFKDFGQYANLLEQIKTTIDNQGLEFDLDYQLSKNDFPMYKITGVYQTEENPFEVDDEELPFD